MAEGRPYLKAMVGGCDTLGIRDTVEGHERRPWLKVRHCRRIVTLSRDGCTVEGWLKAAMVEAAAQLKDG
jgi:hypothetical protein